MIWLTSLTLLVHLNYLTEFEPLCLMTHFFIDRKARDGLHRLPASTPTITG